MCVLTEIDDPAELGTLDSSSCIKPANATYISHLGQVSCWRPITCFLVLDILIALGLSPFKYFSLLISLIIFLVYIN